jgi:hypothetical protein
VTFPERVFNFFANLLFSYRCARGDHRWAVLKQTESQVGRYCLECGVLIIEPR